MRWWLNNCCYFFPSCKICKHTPEKKKKKNGRTLKSLLFALISRAVLDSIARSTFPWAVPRHFCQTQYPWQARVPWTSRASRIRVPETCVVPKNLFSLDSANKKRSTVPQVILVALSQIPMAHHKSGNCLVPQPRLLTSPGRSSSCCPARTALLQEDWGIFSWSILLSGSPALHQPLTQVIGRYLKKRLEQPKILLFNFRWGTHLGSAVGVTALSHPTATVMGKDREGRWQFAIILWQRYTLLGRSNLTDIVHFQST